MLDTCRRLDALASLAHPDGGWGYAPDQPAHLEPTCLALLALAAEPEANASTVAHGWDFIARSTQGDGVYRLEHGRDEAVWPTALVLFTQAALDRPADEVRRTARGLLALRGKAPDPKEVADVHDIDLRLVGWPWAEGNFSWVEPTAWACVALSRAGCGGHPRVAEGRRLLLDRTFDGGGVNYGNRLILGRLTEPMPGPTALLLLALAGHDHPRLTASAFYLTERALASDDIEHLCWARLALEGHRDQPGVAAALPEIQKRIADAVEQRQGEAWLRPAPLRAALTALALGDGARHFAPRPDEPTVDLTPPPVIIPRRKSFGERVRSFFRGAAVETAARLRRPEPPSSVHIARASDYNADLASILSRQYEEFRDRVPLKGKRVVLKPNLVEYHRDKVVNTDPRVVAAAIELCQREGAAEVIVAEGPGHHRNAEHLVRASGLGDVLKHYKVRFVDINHDEPVKTLNLGRLTGLEYLYLSRTIATADVLISLPKLKTHHWAGATLSLKNLFGTLPGICYGWPKNELHWRGIDNSIVDIALTRTPDLAIVDGIVGMEGDGPINGTPKPFGALVMGRDLLAVDATCCRLMQLRPERIGYLVLGQRRGLGLLCEEEIRQLGERVADLAQPFDTVPHHRELCAR